MPSKCKATTYSKMKEYPPLLCSTLCCFSACNSLQDERVSPSFGQDSEYSTVGMCKLNMVLHSIIDFDIQHADVLAEPKFVEGGKLKKYDRVIANVPFGMDWENAGAAKDPYYLSLFIYNELKIQSPPPKRGFVPLSRYVVGYDLLESA